MSETAENGISLWPIIVFAIYWTYLIVTYEQRKGDWFKAFFDSRAPTPEAAAAREHIANSTTTAPKAPDDFDESAFLTEAAKAYERIVTNYGAGNTTELTGLVSTDVLDVFSLHIEASRARGEQPSLEIVTLVDMRIVAKDMDGARPEFKVRFEAEIRVGEPDAGLDHPPHHRSQLLIAVDIWTFQRKNTGSDQTWVVVETDAG
ncbi:Tim44/TimA family putative adaptor protein [Hoeflea sp. G2-23]|uniref:Tim44/TimA family putative adaptor protein n=1 Tax=Hoeflea algicola TaxID=2983763 RepID=A0ABT3Z4I4_9HYPH|nr:Tim44/TimA family putative adaptor protein [Hoeflea algicola]MCY0146685.1 Tim44/TimA family putative adaptor protein [Hoeflea algicola]